MLLASGRPTEAFNYYDAARVEFERVVDRTALPPPPADFVFVASIHRDEQLALTLCGLSAVAEKQGLLESALALAQRADSVRANAEVSNTPFLSDSIAAVHLQLLAGHIDGGYTADLTSMMGRFNELIGSAKLSRYSRLYMCVKSFALHDRRGAPNAAEMARSLITLLEGFPGGAATLFYAEAQTALADFTLRSAAGSAVGATDAVNCLLRALAIRRGLLPPDHPDIAACWASLAVAYGALEREAEAVEAAANALRVGRRSQTACAQGGCGRKVRPDGQPLDACAVCLRTFYCGPACQKADWKAMGHKAECKVLVAEGKAV